MSASTTIAAIASPPGPGRRGVVRISGPEAGELVRALATRPLALLGRAALELRIHDGRGEQPCLLLWMPGPASYTREDVAELHLPGAPPLLAAALARLFELGCAPAAPGEFTRRAFQNGRLDLTQAEGVMELIQAGNERERRAAVELLEGGLGARLASLRRGFVDLRTLAEGSLDFDEADTGHVPSAELAQGAADLAQELARTLAWEVARQAPRALPRVVLAGPPNAGKSTLFNALVPGGRALVSAVAGSTRDGVGGLWPLAGLDCLLLDAPGHDPAARGADREAQALARAERAAADLVLELVDAAGGGAPADAPGVPRLVVWSRADLPGARPAPPWAVAVSARTGDGLADLARGAALHLGAGPGEAGAGLVRELSARHRAALATAGAELARARELFAAQAPLDLAADALRAATDALDAVEGRTTPEDLLDRIFARFCLGK